MAFILLLLWIGASIVIGKLAQASGRSFFIWFVIRVIPPFLAEVNSRT